MAKVNERGAGRKPIFTEEQIAEIRAKREQGIAVSALAKAYGVSRQTLSTYLNRKDQQMEAIIQSMQAWRELKRSFKDINLVDYNMRMDFMCEDECCTMILVDFKHEKIAIKNTTDKIMLRAFGINVYPTWEEFLEFLEDRCFPRTRGNLKLILRDLDLDFYDPLYIIEKTEGRMGEDMQWIKINYLNPQDMGLSLFADTKVDFPVNKDYFACKEKIIAKPFSRDFDEQLDVANELYGSYLKFDFPAKRITDVVDELRAQFLLSEDDIANGRVDGYSEQEFKRVEDTLRYQAAKYKYMFTD